MTPLFPVAGPVLLIVIAVCLIVAVAELWFGRRRVEKKVAQKTAELARDNDRLSAEIEARNEALAVSQQHYRICSELTSDFMFGFEVTPEGHLHLEWLTGAFTRITGYSSEIMLNEKRILEVIHPDHQARFVDFMIRLMAGDSQRTEFNIVALSGGIRVLQVMVRPAADDSGRVARLVGAARDVTEQKALEDRWRKYEFIANSTQDFMALVNADHVVEAVNRPYRAVLSPDKEPIEGQSLARIWGRDAYEQNIKYKLDQCFSGRRVEHEGWFDFHRYGRGYYEVTYNPYFDDRARVTHAVVVSHDMTRRKKAEDELVRSEELYRQLADNANAVLWLASPEDGRLLYLSPAYRRIWGADPKKAQTWPSAVHPEDRAAMFDSNGSPDLTHYTGGQYRVVQPDGTVRWILDRTFPVHDERGRLHRVGGVAVDVTVRKRAEDELVRSEQWNRALVEAIPDTLFRLDRDGRITSYKPARSTLTADLEQELIGQTVTDLFPEAVADQITAAAREVNRLGTAQTIEFQMYDQDRPHYFEGRLAACGPEGELLLILRDITERKRSEKMIADALAEKEILLREVHHRVKNNMQVVSSLLSLQANTIDDPQIAAVFQESQARVRAMSLIHETIHQSGRLAGLDLKDYIGRLAKSLLQFYASQSAQVTLDLDLEVITVGLDQAVPCGLAINELISNSLKYAFIDREQGVISITGGTSPDGRTVLTVADNGRGLPPELDWRHSPTLGLSLVVSLVERQLKGDITLDRSQGARFCIRFGTNAQTKGTLHEPVHDHAGGR